MSNSVGILKTHTHTHTHTYDTMYIYIERYIDSDRNINIFIDYRFISVNIDR
jgi:hypothetical protein